MRSFVFFAGAALLFACSTSNPIADKDPPLGAAGATNDPDPPSPPKATCKPTSTTELNCSDGVDEDCDGYTDCRDSECGGMQCGGEAGLTCKAGACLTEAPGLPDLPVMDNVRVTMNVDTAVVAFEPIAAAMDYRIYPLPNQDDILVGENGEVVIQDAIYRCAGDRPVVRREDDPAGFTDISLAGNILDYTRTEAEAVLGYAYTTPGPDREAVYRVANPAGRGGYAWDYIAPPASEYNSADYVMGEDARNARLTQGYRDDGVAFYAPTHGTVPVYRREYAPGDMGANNVLYYTAGPEYDAREEQGGDIVDMAERFRLLATQEGDSVAVHRIFYLADNAFDVLAAGDARYKRALEQGNLPLTSLTWTGIDKPTTLVIEALDQGCPFPNGYISAFAAPGDPDTQGHYPSILLDDARLESGEVFVNGQHDPNNRPRPIARSFVDVTPEEPPSMDWYENFGPNTTWAPFDQVDTFNNGIFLRRNADWIVEFSGCDEGNTVGPVLGQLVFGGGDYGSSCNMSIIPRNAAPEVKKGTYLHVRMTTEIPSTHRRYPQLMLTTAPTLNVGDVNENDVPVRHRLGALPFEETYQPHSGTEQTLIVQPFSSSHELQIQFCDGRGWGVSAQCPRANIYGYHAGSFEDEWEEPWRPVPVLGDMAGHDRPVRFDAYISTERVYVTLDGKPAGCAILPEGRLREGVMTPVFGSVVYHGGIDEALTPESSPNQYLHNYSLVHYDRKIDEMGLQADVSPPPWDEAVLPCGTRWYGAEE